MLDLVAAETGSGAQVDSSQAASLPRSALGDAGEFLDARAKGRLPPTPRRDRRRHRPGARHRGRRAGRAGRRRTRLPRSRARRAFGLGGRDRRAASASERARAGVTRAVRQAIARIGEHHPQLGEHLQPHHPHRHRTAPTSPDPRALPGRRLHIDRRRPRIRTSPGSAATTLVKERSAPLRSQPIARCAPLVGRSEPSRRPPSRRPLCAPRLYAAHRGHLPSDPICAGLPVGASAIRRRDPTPWRSPEPAGPAHLVSCCNFRLACAPAATSSGYRSSLSPGVKRALGYHG